MFDPSSARKCVSLLPDQCTMQYSIQHQGAGPQLTNIQLVGVAPSGNNPVVITCGFRRQRAREAVQRSEERHPGLCGGGGAFTSCSTAVGDASHRVPYLPVRAGGGQGGLARGLQPFAPLPPSSVSLASASTPPLSNPRQPLQAPPEFCFFDRATTLVPKPQVRWARGVARASPGCCLPQRCARELTSVPLPCFHTLTTAEEHARGLVAEGPSFGSPFLGAGPKAGLLLLQPAHPLWDVVPMPRFAWRKRGETAVVGFASPGHPAASVWGRGARCCPRPSLLDGGALVLLWAVGFSRAFCFAFFFFLFVQSGRPGLVPRPRE